MVLVTESPATDGIKYQPYCLALFVLIESESRKMILLMMLGKGYDTKKRFNNAMVVIHAYRQFPRKIPTRKRVKPLP